MNIAGKPTSKLKLKEQVLFFELLADLLMAGFKLQTALNFIAQLPQANTKACASISERLIQGKGFADSLQPYFQAEIVWQIELAEAHGSLEQTIKTLAYSLQSKAEQTKKLKQLMQYPILLIVMLLFVGGFIRFFFIDQLLSLQGHNRPEGTTQGEYWLLVAGGILVIIILAGWLLLRRLSVEQKLSLGLKIPIVKRLIHYQLGYQVGYVFGLLLKAGQPYQVISNYLLRMSDKSVYHHLGQRLYLAAEEGIAMEDLITSVPYLPPTMSLFFVRGKTKIEVGDDLLAFSKISFQNLIKAYERILASVQPVLFFCIAAGIIGLYAAMLLPMYNMIGELR